jgi:hypothetical protein
VFDCLVVDEIGDRFHFCGTQVCHALVIGRVVGNVSGLDVFFQAADAVHQAGHAGSYPCTTVRFRVAGEGLALCTVIGVGYRVRDDRVVTRNVRNAPGFGSVGQVAVREQYDRCHVS